MISGCGARAVSLKTPTYFIPSKNVVTEFFGQISCLERNEASLAKTKRNVHNKHIHVKSRCPGKRCSGDQMRSTSGSTGSSGGNIISHNFCYTKQHPKYLERELNFELRLFKIIQPIHYENCFNFHCSFLHPSFAKRF